MQPSEIKFTRAPKILIIEDDHLQRKLLKHTLRQTFDCVIFEAADGLDGLKFMLQEKLVPDLILLDLMMPYLNGLEFLTVIRGRPEFDKIPIVICTALPQTSEIRGKITGRIHSYLVKPIKKSKLIEKVVAALNPIRSVVNYHS